MPDPILALEAVALNAPDGRPVFEGLDWRLPAGGRRYLEGGLGNGASAFLRLCAGLAEPARGRVLLAGRPLQVDSLSHPFINAGDLGWVPTDGGLAVNLSLLDNVALPLRFARRMPRAEAEEIAAAWLAKAGLERLAGTRPRVPADRASWLASLARAAAKGSRLWLVDRPAGGLSAATQRAALGILEAAAADPGTSLVLVGGAWMAALGEPLRLEDGRVQEGSGA